MMALSPAWALRRLPLRLLEPLLWRDFALLALGSTVSLLGDGVFYIALTWQALKLGDGPAGLAVVSLLWALPNLLFLLAGGVLSDRIDRRLVMVGADLLRAAVTGSLGLLAVAGSLQLWHLLVLMPLFGAGSAFFNPASTAIVADLVPAEELTRANSFQGAVRPLMLNLLGPAFGGLLVAVAGPGIAFLFDAATFVVSGLATLAITARPGVSVAAADSATPLREIGEGLGFVRANSWCWATLAGTSLGLLTFSGPVRIILPYLVTSDLGAGPESLGLVFAVGGCGSILMSIAVGQIGVSRHQVAAMNLAAAFAAMFVGLYGAMAGVWQACLITFVVSGLFALTNIIWQTLLQSLVPRELLGRVSSVDWLIGTGLVPLSFALTGPAALTFGHRATIAGGGLIAAAAFAAILLVPGVRQLRAEQPAS